MTGQLTENMYYPRYLGQQSSVLFGLRDSQMPLDAATHNSGWFNKAGRYLGHGDLTLENLRVIAEGLEAGEVFVVLSEYKTLGLDQHPSPGPYNHDLPYIAKYAMFVIVQGQVYARREFPNSPDCPMELISEQEIYQLLTAPKARVNQLLKGR
jgi:hypothetical protein